MQMFFLVLRAVLKDVLALVQERIGDLRMWDLLYAQVHVCIPICIFRNVLCNH